MRPLDSHVFSMPRRFSKKQCKNFSRMGFTQRASCAPWITRSLPTKRRDPKTRAQTKCAVGTGYFRDGYCRPEDNGNHIVCAEMTKPFLDYVASKGNDLSSVTSPGKRWCICKHWWDKSRQDGYAPKLVPEATHASFFSHSRQPNRRNRPSKKRP